MFCELVKNRVKFTYVRCLCVQICINKIKYSSGAQWGAKKMSLTFQGLAFACRANAATENSSGWNGCLPFP